MAIVIPSNSRGPIISLALPASASPVSVSVRNETTGKSLKLNLPADWDGTDVSLDFYRRTIKDAAGADRSGLLDVDDNALWLETPAFTAGCAVTLGVGDLRKDFIDTLATELQFIAVDGAHVYWVNSAGHCIGRANLDGTEAEPEFIKTPAKGFPVGLAVSATFIYWTDLLGSIGRAKLDGTEVNAEFITAPSAPGGIAVDGANIYWSDSVVGGRAVLGRSKLDGSDVEPEAISEPEKSGALGGVAIDATYLYLCNSAAGKPIWRALKPMPYALTASFSWEQGYY